ncbi:hypothetical protein AB5I41_13045 [Sphingomonas sp. MMS24-JH45]
MPSANLKLGITPTLIARFAYSKAISRPDFSQLQHHLDRAGGRRRAVPARRARGFVRSGCPPGRGGPVRPDREWYFARVGSITAALFYKDAVERHRQRHRPGARRDQQRQHAIGRLHRAAEHDGSGQDEGVRDRVPAILRLPARAVVGAGGAGELHLCRTVEHPALRLGAGGASATTVDVTALPLEGLSRHTVNATVFLRRGRCRSARRITGARATC